MTPMVLTAVITLLASLLLPLAVRPWLVRMGVVDVPSARSSHVKATIRGMGVAAALATAAGYLAAVLLGAVTVDRSVFAAVLATIAACAAVGWVEDLRGMSIRGRAAAQLGIGAAGSAALIVLTGQSFWWLPLAAVAIAAYVNIANFMDGVNGISGLHGVTAGGAYAAAGLLAEQPWLTAGGTVLAMSFLGFLPWNLGRGSVFLGDVGSYLLGASVAALAVAGFFSGVYVEYVLSPILVYAADTGYTLLRRIKAGERWYASHREHVYQRLTDVGFTHLQSAATVTACTLAVIVLGFVAATAPLPAVALCVAGSLLVLALYLASPDLIRRHRRRSKVTRLPVA
ncbi:glycosyltransferase family 4 protein [Arthrobacter sp. B3I4]|uniref:MraY family glycosyltransferase n=1 Tax=Arthrobacter sp. B3I4 TaxID=3042267 RepID=UPI00277ED288|nr:glycosyltransferase family 4 protein [Arthrobacter sp. B3I4]MDQ0755849.1 UDP-GlcNAc:undecaprenyl-phosphate GlcNAc-1-phosphate transferase [Arthrobacter sp. B3I4]